METNILDTIAEIAHTFEADIRFSASCNPDERALLTLKAVTQLVSSLSPIDYSLGTLEEKNEARQHFRKCLSDLCELGPLWHHGLIKPRGYPGDYFLLNAIYSNVPITDDAVGCELDRAFLTSPLAETVRKRKDAIVSFLVNEIRSSSKNNVRVLDLACGPCQDVFEIQRALNFKNLPLFICIDHDDEALSFAKDLTPDLATNQTQFLNLNALRLKSSSSPLLSEPFNIVYSVGLLDYIPDRIANHAIRYWWDLAGPKGILLLTVKDRDCYNPTFYDWMADWTFIPRNQAGFKDLLESSLGVEDIAIVRDSTGVSIQAVIRKK